MDFNLSSLLQQYLGGTHNVPHEQVENDFQQLAQSVPQEAMAQGVTEALRSDQTPPFPQMVGQLFDSGNPQQRAGMLNQLLGNINPALLTSLAGGVLGSLFHGNNRPTVTPEIASQLTPQQVQEIATKAEQQNPNIVDKMGDFYAAHPTLVKTIGGAALAIILGRMAEGMKH